MTNVRDSLFPNKFLFLLLRNMFSRSQWSSCHTSKEGVLVYSQYCRLKLVSVSLHDIFYCSMHDAKGVMHEVNQPCSMMFLSNDDAAFQKAHV